jgi:hypothetical protein
MIFVTLVWWIGRQAQECVIGFLFHPNYSVPCKGTGTKTKQTRVENTGFETQTKERAVPWIYTQAHNDTTRDEIHNHLSNTCGTKAITQHRYSHAPTDIGTIIDIPMVKQRAHLYKYQKWEWGPGVCNDTVPGGICDNLSHVDMGIFTWSHKLSHVDSKFHMMLCK